MSSSKRDNPIHEDLLWLAYQFVNDELTADESDEFTQRLGEDQTAREAVAAAVELDATLLAALKLPAGQPVGVAAETTPQRAGEISASRWSHRLAWMALGTAACLAAMLIGPGLFRDAGDSDTAALQSVPPANNVPAATEASSSELALLWASWASPSESEVVQAPAAETGLVSSTPYWSNWEGAEVDLAGDLAAESTADEVPSWLVTAVSLDAEMMDLHERMPENIPPAPQEN